METINKGNKIDQEKIKNENEGMDIVNEIIKLYQNDPISNRVIHYLLKKYKIVPLNAIESIRLHREEILLNIVNIYKKMWDARGKIILKAIQNTDKPMKIVIKKGGENGKIYKTGEATIKKNEDNKGNSNSQKSSGKIDKRNSNRI